MADDLLEQPLLAQAVGRQLVVDDRIDRNRRLRQPVRQRLLPGVERPEALGLKLDEAGVADSFDERAGGLGPRSKRQHDDAGERRDQKQAKQVAERHADDFTAMLMPMKTALIGAGGRSRLLVSGAEAQIYPRLTQIADGVYTYEQADPTKRGVAVNNLIVVTSEGVLVADGQGTVDNTKRLVDDIAALTPQPVRYVVVGSIHGDHRGGDAAFPAGVTFVKAKTDLTLGGREIHILFLGRAHTGTDLEVYLPRERHHVHERVVLQRYLPVDGKWVSQ